MLEPNGFWSYSRQDDELSNAELTALRKRIGNELSLLYGQEVKLWQDIAAIPFGADWKEQITEALNTSTFFIPIITPSFFESNYCIDELNIFRRREKSLGRNDLILPFQFIDISDLQPNDVHYREELQFIRSRQMFDFKSYRGIGINDIKVSRQLAIFSLGIRRRLRSPTMSSTSDISTEPWKQPTNYVYGSDRIKHFNAKLVRRRPRSFMISFSLSGTEHIIAYRCRNYYLWDYVYSINTGYRQSSCPAIML